MTDIEHMIAWIESSQPHYVQLIQLERDRKNVDPSHNVSLAQRAFFIVTSAYREATRGGDMFVEQWSAAQLLEQ